MRWFRHFTILLGLALFSGCGVIPGPVVEINSHLNEIQHSANIAGQLSYITNPVDVTLEVEVNGNYSTIALRLSHNDLMASSGEPLIVKPLPNYYDRRILSVGSDANTVEWFSIPTYFDNSGDMWICAGVYGSKWRWSSGSWRMTKAEITLNCTRIDL